jgi:hypothetical protein
MWRSISCAVALTTPFGCSIRDCADSGETCDSGVDYEVSVDEDWWRDDDSEDDSEDDKGLGETFAVTWVDACTVHVGVVRPERENYRFGIHHETDNAYIGEVCIATTNGICHTIPTTGHRTLTSVNDTACGGAGKDAAEADSTTFVHRAMPLVFTFYDEGGQLLSHTCRGCGASADE